MYQWFKSTPRKKYFICNSWLNLHNHWNYSTWQVFTLLDPDDVTSWTGMCICRVCGNNAVQFQSCDGSSYCTVLGENGRTDIVSCQLRDSSSYEISARSEAISSRDPPPIVPGAWTWHYEQRYGQMMKAEQMCMAKTTVTDCPWWWKVCGKQFCRTGASQFCNSLVSSPDLITARILHLAGDNIIAAIFS